MLYRAFEFVAFLAMAMGWAFLISSWSVVHGPMPVWFIYVATGGCGLIFLGSALRDYLRNRL